MNWKILTKIFVAWCVRTRTLLNCVTCLRNSKPCRFCCAYPGWTWQYSSPDELCYLLSFNTECVLFWLFSPRHVFSGRHFGALCQQTRFIVPVESAGADRVLIVPEDSGSHRHRGLEQQTTSIIDLTQNYRINPRILHVLASAKPDSPLSMNVCSCNRCIYKIREEVFPRFFRWCVSHWSFIVWNRLLIRLHFPWQITWGIHVQKKRNDGDESLKFGNW